VKKLIRLSQEHLVIESHVGERYRSSEKLKRRKEIQKKNRAYQVKPVASVPTNAISALLLDVDPFNMG